jgi:hypothetical protein
MSITVKPYVTGGWEVDIRVLLPDGTVICARKKGASAKRVQCRMLGRSARAASVAATGIRIQPRRWCSAHQHSESSRHGFCRVTRKQIG